MKKDKKALYESVMNIVAKEIKKALTEGVDDYSIAREIYRKAKEYSDTNKNDVYYIIMHVWHEEGKGLSTLPIAMFNTELSKFNTNRQPKDQILGFTNDCFDGEIIERENALFNAISKFEENRESWISFEGSKVVFCIKLSDIGIDKCRQLLKTRDERWERNKYGRDPLTQTMPQRMDLHRFKKKVKQMEQDYLSFMKYEKEYEIPVFYIEELRSKIEKILYKSKVMTKFAIKDENLFMRKIIDSIFDIAKEMENNQE